MWFSLRDATGGGATKGGGGAEQARDARRRDRCRGTRQSSIYALRIRAAILCRTRATMALVGGVAHPDACACVQDGCVRCACPLFPRLPTVQVEFSHRGRVAWVWLNRPRRLNALSKGVLEELLLVCRELQPRHRVAVVVLGGRGRSFCAGADLGDPPGVVEGQAVPSHSAGHATAARRPCTGAPSRVPLRERRYAAQLGHRAIAAWEELDAITIARVHGHAAGGGFGLMLACDLRVVHASTRLWLPEIDLGIPLTWGLTARLYGELGPARAKEAVLLGGTVAVDAAARMGLVNRVVGCGSDACSDRRGAGGSVSLSLDELDDEVGGLVEHLLAKDAGALHQVKAQCVALGRRHRWGDVTVTDADLFVTQRLMTRQPASAAYTASGESISEACEHTVDGHANDVAAQERAARHSDSAVGRRDHHSATGSHGGWPRLGRSKL